MTSPAGRTTRPLLLRLIILVIIIQQWIGNNRTSIAISSLSDLASNSAKIKPTSTKVDETHVYRHVFPAPLDTSTRRTSIIKETAGTTTLQNICLRQLQSKGNIELLSFRSENDTNSGSFVINQKLRKSQDDVLQTTAVSSASEWEEVAQRAEWILDNDGNSDDDNNGVIWIYGWQERNNPGHCLNDFSFSVVLDVLDEAEPNEGDKESRPFYPLFIHTNQTHIQPSCDTVCCQMFAERFGLIDYDRQIIPSANMPPQQQKNEVLSPLCFERITFPKLEGVRHVYNEEIYRGIHLLRQRSFQMLGDVLDPSPWLEESEDGSSSSGSATATILLYDRSDASTRHLTDAPEIKAELERLYHVKVDRIGGEDWSKANTTQQAVIYNYHRYILSPHGAHFINIIHARPGTKVLEIQCYVNNRRWNLHQQWFAKWAHAIDVSWKIFTEMDGCKEDGQILINYSPQEVHVDVSKIVAEAADHFDLAPR